MRTELPIKADAFFDLPICLDCPEADIETVRQQDAVKGEYQALFCKHTPACARAYQAGKNFRDIAI